jgi:hypothetical protein
MLDAVGNLARDGWVIGIACATALAHAVVSLIEAIIGFVMAIIDGEPVAGLGFGFVYDPPYTFVLNDHYVPYGDVVRGVVLLAVVVIASALALHATRTDEEPAT